MPARVELFLQRPQKPTLGLCRRVRTIDQTEPTRVRDDPQRLTLLGRDQCVEQQARFAGGPRSFADPIIEHLDPNHVLAGFQQRCKVDRIDIQLTRITGGRAPLHALPIHSQTITTVGRHPTDRAHRFLRQFEFLTKQYERVG